MAPKVSTCGDVSLVPTTGSWQSWDSANIQSNSLFYVMSDPRSTSGYPSNEIDSVIIQHTACRFADRMWRFTDKAGFNVIYARVSMTVNILSNPVGIATSISITNKVAEICCQNNGLTKQQISDAIQKSLGNQDYPEYENLFKFPPSNAQVRVWTPPAGSPAPIPPDISDQIGDGAQDAQNGAQRPDGGSGTEWYVPAWNNPATGQSGGGLTDTNSIAAPDFLNNYTLIFLAIIILLIVIIIAVAIIMSRGKKK